MKINQKRLIKKIATNPKNLIKEEFEDLEKSFCPEEILHIILIVSNVKQRLQMIYFANYINEYMKKFDSN